MADELTEKEIGQISDALLENRKIEAIKIYRETTGCGLMEAKEFIEKLGVYNPNTNPATIDLNFDSSVNWLFDSI